MNTSQSRSNRLKANLSDTWEIKHTAEVNVRTFLRFPILAKPKCASVGIFLKIIVFSFKTFGFMFVIKQSVYSAAETDGSSSTGAF